MVSVQRQPPCSGSGLRCAISLICLGAFTAGSPAASLTAQGQAARVVFILDRESSRFQPLVDATSREIGDFFRPGEVEVLPNDNARLAIHAASRIVALGRASEIIVSSVTRELIEGGKRPPLRGKWAS